MTIQETLKIKTNGTLYDKDYRRKGLRSGKRGDFNNLYLKKLMVVIPYLVIVIGVIG